MPPPEEEQAVSHHQQQFAAPRKHYKIIFIKAPSAPSISQQIAAAQAQNEEKTLIYVLVKKPEDISVGHGAAAAPALPVSKPEVYFIKYKTQKEQGHSIGGGSSSSANIGGGSATDFQVSNPASAYGAPFKK